MILYKKYIKERHTNSKVYNMCAQLGQKPYLQTETIIFHTHAHTLANMKTHTHHVNRLVFIISTIYRLLCFRKISTVVRLRNTANACTEVDARNQMNETQSPPFPSTRSIYRVVYRSLLAARWITSSRNNFCDERSKRGESLLLCEFFGRVLCSMVVFVLLRYRTAGLDTVVIQMARWCHQR